MNIGIWSRALDLATRTPPERQRSVDFLRAASILVVVVGHWVIAAPWVDDSGAHIAHMLGHQTWTQWLTWILQVIPVFFFVGGFANGISWDAALRDRKPYRVWLAGRLGRLLRPVLPLIMFWAVAGLLAVQAGVSSGMVRIASQIALVPTWFLAVYLLQVLLVPVTRAAWNRYGMASFWVPAAAAALVDLAYFRYGMHGFGWANYLLLWGAVHQLGFGWLDNRCARGSRAAFWCLGGLLLLVLLTEYGPWPRSLVGVPGAEVSNTTPPHIPLLALAAFQFGAVRLLENRLRRLLENLNGWAATVLVNGMIMTVFLWHSTVMMLLFGVSLLMDGAGLKTYPGSGPWWLLKLVWIGLFTAVLLPVVGFASRWERAGPGGPVPGALRQVAGSLVLGGGLGFLAYHGVVHPESGALSLVPLLLPFLGALIAGLIFNRLWTAGG